MATRAFPASSNPGPCRTSASKEGNGWARATCQRVLQAGTFPFGGNATTKGQRDPMGVGPIEDWTLLRGARVEIRRQGISVCSGSVDAVTEDGNILWLSATPDGRRLFEKAELYEVWAAEDRDGFHYQISKAFDHH